MDRIEAWLVARLGVVSSVIELRRAAGRVRECHGDLHLGNLVVHAGQMTAFDAIEFSPGLRWIDVANDVAFLVMDLESRGRPDLARIVRSSWLEAADDHAAVLVLPVYEVYRAVVRAAVAALRAGDTSADRAETNRYLDLAKRLMRPARPVLYVTSGVSGCGKTTLAGGLVAVSGAVRLRSDVERKRLAGMRPTDRPGDAASTASLYGAPMTRRVYERLASLTGTLLDGGASVVVDAACLQGWQPGELAAVARQRQVPIVWLEIDVSLETTLARVAARQASAGDASDASPEVVREQFASREPVTVAELTGMGGPTTRLVRVTEGDLADPGFAARISEAVG